MKYHSKSLLLSLLIHSSLFAALFYLYTTVVPKVLYPKEKRICVSLCTIQKESKRSEVKVAAAPPPPPPSQEKPTPKKAEIQKKHLIKKKPLLKKKKKPVVKKKRVHKIVKNPSPKIIKPKVEPTKQKVIKKIEEIKEVKYERDEPVVKTKLQNPPQVQKCATKESVYIEHNINRIATLIKENLYYPRRARKRGVEGIVVVKFLLHRDGRVSDAHIVSSQSDILGRAALKTINQLSGEFPKPSDELSLTVPINYELH